MKARLLSLMALVNASFSASGATTIYDQWLHFNNLTGDKGQLTITLHGENESQPSVNNGSLTIPTGGHARVDLSSIGNLAWPTNGYSGIQLVFSAANLGSAYQQLFLFNGNISSGVAVNQNGMITDGNGYPTHGNAFQADTGDTLTLTAMFNRNGGVRYYINGENIYNNTGWKSGSGNWTSLDIGNSCSAGATTYDGLDMTLNGLVLFSTDSTAAADADAAARRVYATIPEPATAGLGLLALVVFTLRRRRA